MSDSHPTSPKERAGASRRETTRGPTFRPRVDICETANELTLIADLPGVRPEDVDLRYENGELLLHGKVRSRHEGSYLMQEYDVGDFYRVFTISETIDSSRIEAECKHGVLTVHLPKMEAARPRQIQVRSS